MKKTNYTIIFLIIVIFGVISFFLFQNDVSYNENKRERAREFEESILKGFGDGNAGLTLSYDSERLIISGDKGPDINFENNTSEPIVFSDAGFQKSIYFWDEVHKEWLEASMSKVSLPFEYTLMPDESVFSYKFGFLTPLNIEPISPSEIDQIEEYSYVMLLFSGLGADSSANYFAYLELEVVE